MRNLRCVRISAGNLFRQICGQNHIVHIRIFGQICGMQHSKTSITNLIDNILRNIRIESVPYQHIPETRAIDGGNHIHGFRADVGLPQGNHLFLPLCRHSVSARGNMREHSHVKKTLAVQLAFNRQET